MKKIINYVPFLLLASCNNNSKSAESTERIQVKDTVEKTIVSRQKAGLQAECDSVVMYDLGDISSEGAEAEACYIKKKLVKCKALIFGAGGRMEVLFLVRDSLVEVTERTYKYKKPLTEIKDESDIVLSDSAAYSIDKRSGRLVSGRKSINAEKTYTEIFKKIPGFL